MKRLIAGPRAVEEALSSHPERITVIYYEGVAAPSVRKLLQRAEAQRVRTEERSKAALSALAGALRHQGVLALAGDYPYAALPDLLPADATHPLLLALDQVQDPHNLGAIVRSAVAFAAAGVITLRDRAAPVTPAAVRASAGATEQARIARVTNLARTLAALRERGLQVVGLCGEAPQPLLALPYPEAGRVLVVGSEGKGLRPLVRKQCDHLARIELPGPMASLNAAVAAGVATFVSHLQRTQGATR